MPYNKLSSSHFFKKNSKPSMTAIVTQIHSLLKDVGPSQKSNGQTITDTYDSFNASMSLLKKMALDGKDKQAATEFLNIYRKVNPKFSTILQGGHKYDDFLLVEQLNIQFFQFKQFANAESTTVQQSDSRAAPAA